MEKAIAMVLEDRNGTTADIAQQLNISQGSVYSVWHNSLGLCKVGTQEVDRRA